MKAITKANLRVRLSPSTLFGVTVGVVQQGKPVDVVSVKDGWALVELYGGGSPIFELGGSVPRYGYMSAAYLDFNTNPVPPPQPPPVTAGFNRLGVNVINYGRGAEKAVANGCKIVLVMDDEDLAAAIKRANPSVFVVFRRYIHNWQLGGDELAARVGGNYTYIDAYQLYNEADSGSAGSYGDERQINDRITNELRAADILLRKGCGVLLGSYSMGTPDFTSQWAINAVKRYALLYNTNPRVWFDMHSYSPAMGRFHQPVQKAVLSLQTKAIGNVGRNTGVLATWYQDTERGFAPSQSPLQNKPMDIWFEGRWRWLFTHCGFDARQRKIVMTETGVDEGGIGGFPAHNANLQDFGAWVKAWLAYQAQPVMVGATEYPSPVLGAMLYQYGEYTAQNWQGYEIAPYFSELQGLAWA